MERRALALKAPLLPRIAPARMRARVRARVGYMESVVFGMVLWTPGPLNCVVLLTRGC